MKLFSVATLTILLTASAAMSHEYVAKPGALTARAGQAIPVEVVSSHVFLRSQELEDTATSHAGIWTEGKRTEIPLEADATAMLFRGTATAPSDACFLVTGHRAGQVWSTTPQGTRRVGREAPGASNVREFEKFSKAIVNARGGEDACLRPIGDRLEIVTSVSPADMKPGQDIEVTVLFDGKKLTTPVFATYDGFSGEENTYAYYTEGRPDGTARVRITQPGLWMIRAEHAAPEKTATHDRYVARTVLLFSVK